MNIGTIISNWIRTGNPPTPNEAREVERVLNNTSLAHAVNWPSTDINYSDVSPFRESIISKQRSWFL